MPQETVLKKAELRVREGEALIAQQTELVDKLAGIGLPLYDAVLMLQELRAAQRRRIALLEVLRDQR